MKVKFREVKTRCQKIVENYRKVRKDDREFPEFFIHSLAADGSKGEIHLYRKKHGGEAYVSKRSIDFESHAELALIMESLGRAWEASTA